MVRGLLTFLAAVAGALLGAQIASEVWFVLEHLGVVVTPTCNDVFQGTVHAICARPRIMEVVGLATVALCAALASAVAWRVLRALAATRAERDTTR